LGRFEEYIGLTVSIALGLGVPLILFGVEKMRRRMGN